MSSYGPLELLIVRFRDPDPSPEVIAALRELVEAGTIRVVDLVFVRKGDDGALAWSEPESIADRLGIADITSDLVEFLSESDMEALTAALPNGEAAGLMLFENTWATRFANAVRASGGALVLSERIPAFVVDELEATLAADVATT